MQCSNSEAGGHTGSTRRCSGRCTAWQDKTCCNVAQLGTAQHSMAQHSMAQHSTAWHGTAQHYRVWDSTAQHSTAEHSTAQHSTAHLMEASSSMAVIGSRKLVTSAMCTPSSRLPLGSSRTCSASSMSLQPGGSTLQMGRCLKSSLQPVCGDID